MYFRKHSVNPISCFLSADGWPCGMTLRKASLQNALKRTMRWQFDHQTYRLWEFCAQWWINRLSISQLIFPYSTETCTRWLYVICTFTQKQRLTKVLNPRASFATRIFRLRLFLFFLLGSAALPSFCRHFLSRKRSNNQLQCGQTKGCLLFHREEWRNRKWRNKIFVVQLRRPTARRCVTPSALTGFNVLRGLV